MEEFTGQKLVCVRAERVVFANLSFALTDGGAIRLSGANGSGKSSLLRVMARLLPVAAGSLAWNGASLDEDPDAHDARLAYVGHQDAIKPLLTVAENVAFWARLGGGGPGGRVRGLGFAPSGAARGRACQITMSRAHRDLVLAAKRTANGGGSVGRLATSPGKLVSRLACLSKRGGLSVSNLAGDCDANGPESWQHCDSGHDVVWVGLWSGVIVVGAVARPPARRRFAIRRCGCRR